jgi:hypothetical protein
MAGVPNFSASGTCLAFGDVIQASVLRFLTPDARRFPSK